MRRVLLAGFEGFAGAADNPSALAVRAIAADPPPGMLLRSVVLPVTYTGAWPTLEERLRSFRPDILIAAGLAGGRAEISVERVAINMDDARIADNAGEQRIDLPVLAGGPAAYFASVPIKAVVAGIRAAGVPAQVSQNAGTFICNHIFYRTCHWAATQQPSARVGFLHLPWLPAQAAEMPGGPSMALAEVVMGLRAAVLVAVATEQDLRVAEGAAS